MDPFDLDGADVPTLAIVELRGARVGMPGEARRGFDVAAVLLVEGDAGGAKGVVADRGGQADVATAAFDHA
jgi:hypothetical protein